MKHILIEEEALSIYSPIGYRRCILELSIHPLHHIRVVADEVNSVVVTGSGIAGGEEHSLGSTCENCTKKIISMKSILQYTIIH